MSPVKFVVLSDLHLGPPCVPVNGPDTGARTAGAQETVRRDHADAAFVLLAGDLAARGEAAAYRHRQDMPAGMPIPVRVTPGCHDERATFLSLFGPGFDDLQGRVSLAPDAGGYRVILPDTTEPGLVGGRLCRGLSRRAAPASRHPAGDRRSRPSAPGTALWRGIPMAALAGSHYPVRPDVPGVPDQQREGPAQMAVVLPHPDGVTVHIQDHSDRHPTLAPGLFLQTCARPEHRRSPNSRSCWRTPATFR